MKNNGHGLGIDIVMRVVWRRAFDDNLGAKRVGAIYPRQVLHGLDWIAIGAGQCEKLLLGQGLRLVVAFFALAENRGFVNQVGFFLEIKFALRERLGAIVLAFKHRVIGNRDFPA